MLTTDNFEQTLIIIKKIKIVRNFTTQRQLLWCIDFDSFFSVLNVYVCVENNYGHSEYILNLTHFI